MSTRRLPEQQSHPRGEVIPQLLGVPCLRELLAVRPQRRRRVRVAELPRHRLHVGAETVHEQRREEVPACALRVFAELGLDPPAAVMTDNAVVYRRSRGFGDLLGQSGIRPIRTPAYTSRWNGKVERFIQTLQNEWAYSHTWPDSRARARSLQSFIRYYNRRRPHSSLGDRPPISRVHNLRGQDS
jgi:hypothetical protein